MYIENSENHDPSVNTGAKEGLRSLIIKNRLLINYNFTIYNIAMQASQNSKYWFCGRYCCLWRGLKFNIKVYMERLKNLYSRIFTLRFVLFVSILIHYPGNSDSLHFFTNALSLTSSGLSFSFCLFPTFFLINVNV